MECFSTICLTVCDIEMTNYSEGESLRSQHQAICEKLNVDGSTGDRSWEKFIEIRSTYNLDGDPLHWLCCSLFVTCRETITPTVGNTNAVL